MVNTLHKEKGSGFDEKAKAIAAAKEIFAEMEEEEDHRPKRLPAEFRKAQLMEEAKSAFAEKGYQAAGTQDIANRCGVSQAALFKHFPTKSTLYDSIVQEELESLINSCGPKQLRSPGISLREGLKEYFEAFVEYCESNPRFLKVLLHGALQKDHYAKMFVDQFFNPWTTQFVSAIEKGIKEGELKNVPAKTVAVLIWSAVFQFMIMKHVFNVDQVFGLSNEEVIESYLDMVFRGIEKITTRRFATT